MDPTAVITIISQVIKLAVDVGPSVIQAVSDAEPFAKSIYDSLFGATPPTQAQVDALEAQLDKLSADFDTPLAADTDGSTET